MKSKKVTKDITMMWGVRHKFEIRIRAGREVRNETSDGRKLPEGEYFLEDIPFTETPPYTSFPVDSFYRHDAIHYGIKLFEHQVVDVDLLSSDFRGRIERSVNSQR